MDQPVLLISHRGALGDFVLCLPTWISLRIHFTGYTIIGLGKPQHFELAKQLGLVDHIENSESKNWLPFYEGISLPDSHGQIRSVLHYGPVIEPLQILSQKQQLEHCLFIPVLPKETQHILDHHYEIHSQWGLPSIDTYRDFLPSLASQSTKTLIHPGAGSHRKTFNPEFYLFVANELKNLGYPDIHIILGPQEEELGKYYQSQYPILRPKSPLECYQILSGACLYIGNDTGLSHLSSLMGNPTIGLYNSTSIKNWGLRGPHTHNIEAKEEAIAMAKIQKALPRFGERVRVLLEKSAATY